MGTVMTWLVVLAFVPLGVAWGLWLLFVVLALLPVRTAARHSGGDDGARVVIDVLIPAHNEELLLPRLLETLRLQTAAGRERMGRVLVVADFCSDRTASLAWAGHAEVLERQSGPRGKPAALREGLAWLKARSEVPTERRAVMILDADCTVTPNLLEQTAAALDGGAMVTQAAYILDEAQRPAVAPKSGKRLQTSAIIAFGLKNWIRPRGMDRLGLPTQLFGTGMCFRSEVLENISFDDHLTEDLAISHSLLIAGVAPRFLSAALVRSPLPEERSAMSTQKLRWETGQVQTWTKLPVMLMRLVGRGRLRSAVALVDWSAPPLAMGVIYWGGVTFASLVLVALHVVLPWVLWIPVMTMAALMVYVVVGGSQVSGITAVGRMMLSIPRFIGWKLALYTQMLTGRGPRAWQRTPRDGTLSAPGVVGQEAVHPK